MTEPAFKTASWPALDCIKEPQIQVVVAAFAEHAENLPSDELRVARVRPLLEHVFGWREPEPRKGLTFTLWVARNVVVSGLAQQSEGDVEALAADLAIRSGYTPLALRASKQIVANYSGRERHQNAALFTLLSDTILDLS